jgi:hypothetical protein
MKSTTMLMLSLAVSIAGCQRGQTATHTDAAPTPRQLGPAQTVCVSHLIKTDETQVIGGKKFPMVVKSEIKCGTVRIGMTQAEVTTELGAIDGPGLVSSSTTAAGTVEQWSYFGSVDHNKRPVLEFDNGVLAAISTP